MYSRPSFLPRSSSLVAWLNPDIIILALLCSICLFTKFLSGLRAVKLDASTPYLTCNPAIFSTKFFCFDPEVYTKLDVGPTVWGGIPFIKVPNGSFLKSAITSAAALLTVLEFSV